MAMGLQTSIISREDNKADDHPMAATIVRTYNDINSESPSRVRTSAV